MGVISVLNLTKVKVNIHFVTRRIGFMRFSGLSRFLRLV